MDRSSETIRSIVYVSRAVGPWTASSLHDLAARSGRMNAARGVTGSLFYRDGQFAQVIEGAPAALDEIYRRIDIDPRHEDIKVLLDASVTARSFRGWSLDGLPAAEAPYPECTAPVSIGAEGQGFIAMFERAGKTFREGEMKTVPRQDRATATLKRILGAARRLGARHGPDGVTFKALAQESNVGLQSIYRYFSTTDSIGKMVVRERQLHYLALYRTRLEAAHFASLTELAGHYASLWSSNYLADARVPARIHMALIRRFHDIAYDELWELADTVIATMTRCGFDTTSQDLKPRIAMSLAAVGAAAKMIALNDPGRLRRGDFRDMAAAIFLTGLQGAPPLFTGFGETLFPQEHPLAK